MSGEAPGVTKASETPADDTPENVTITNSRSPRAAEPPRGKGRALPIVLAALCVVAAVVVGLLGWHAIGVARANRDAQQALDSARTRSVLVLSYAPGTVDADIAKAREQLAGTFAAEFDKLVDAVVIPATKQQGLASKVEITHSALIESYPDRADVLLLMHQVVTGDKQPQQEGNLQVKVTVTKAPDNRWLITNLQQI